MIIKKEIKNQKSPNKINRLLLIYFILSIIFISIPSLMVLKSSGFKKAKTQFFDKISRSGRINYIYLPKIFFESLKSNFTNFEKIDLKLSFEDILVLENLRSKSLKKGELPPRHLIPKVDIEIKHKGKNFYGDARLKGDRILHFENKKTTSYKIELDRDNYLFGLKKFSIQKPVVRNYVHEWIFHKLAEEFDIIQLKYEFIELYVNGEDYGLFVIEEGFGKELIERNKRRNGPIFSLNEDLNYTNVNPVFEIYNKKYWEQYENEPLALIASQKLKNFFNKKIKAEEVFDLEKWASYFAIVDLTGTLHGALLKSVKFYYNPISGLFEPIPFDGHRFKPNFNEYNLLYDNKLVIDIINNLDTEDEKIGIGWIKNFFYSDNNLNQNFYNLYVEKLTQISSNLFISDFLSENLKTIDKINSHIYSDSFWYHDKGSEMGLYYFSLKDFHYQAENISKKLNKNGGLQVLKISKRPELLVRDYFNSYSISKIKDLICFDGVKERNIKINKKLINFSDTIVNIPNFNSELKCRYVSIYNEKSKKLELQKIDYINSSYLYKKFSNKKNLLYKKFFRQENNKLFLKNDRTVIDRNIYIPKNFEIIIKNNQNLFLTNNAFIISESPWIIGDLKGITYIGGLIDNMGGGILIKNTKKKSIIRNTKFSYLKGIDANSFKEFNIMGSINFYEADVKILKTEFENIFSEDAINVFRSNFEIIENSFKNIFSDALDIDFGNGNIFLSNFENIQNDAIDFSGSIANVKSSKFKNVDDKVISVGEKSDVNISNIIASDAFVGIVSKDGSMVKVEEIEFDNVEIPFSAYQKKKEYDFGKLVVKKYNIKNFDTKWLKDKGSQIKADQDFLKNSSNDILSIIYER